MDSNLKRINKIMVLVISLVTLFGLFSTAKVLAAPLEKTNVKVISFSIEHDNTSTSTSFSKYERVKLKMTWDASMYQNILQEGDYFDVKLPSNMVFPIHSTATNFDLFAPDGNIVAKAVVSPIIGGGGTVRVTFTDYVNSRYNIKGNMWLAAEFSVTVTPGTTTLIEVIVNGEVIKIPVDIKPLPPGPTEETTELLNKSGVAVPNEGGQVQWYMTINKKKGVFSNVVIKDKLTTTDGNLQGMHYIENSFVLREVVWNKYGQYVKTISTADVSAQIQFNADSTAFTFNMGNIGNRQYLLTYKSTYVPGTKLKNTAKFTAYEETATATSYFQSASSGGTGTGDLLSKMKIIKVDADDATKKLVGAKFKVTKLADNTTFELITDASGEILSERLIPGAYKVEEITAPSGYQMDITPQIVTIESDKTTIITFKDTKSVGKIELTKSDATTKALLAGVEFDILDDTRNIVDHITTGLSGVATSRNLPLGNYTLVETKAPKGYECDATPIPVTIGTHNGIVKVKATDMPSVGKIVISKFDKETRNRLAGMVFKIRNVETGAEKTIEMKTYNIMEITNLPLGTYEIVKVTAPVGYELDSTVHTLVIEKNGDVKNLDIYDVRKPKISVEQGKKVGTPLPKTDSVAHGVQTEGNFSMSALTTVLALVLGIIAFVKHNRKKA